MRKATSILVIVATLLLHARAPVVVAQTSTDQLQNELRLRNAEIESINNRIKDYQDQLDSLANKQAGLQNDIERIAGQVALAELDVEALQLSIDAERLQVEIVEKQVREALAGLKRQKQFLKSTIVDLQRSQDTSAAEILFSSAGMHEALAGIKRKESVSGQLQERLEDTRSLRDQLQEKQQAQQEKVDTLLELETELEAQIIALEQRKRAADLLIEETNSSEEQYRNIMNQLQGEQRQITSRITQLQGEIQKRIREEGGEELIGTSSTAITYPLESYIITATFHDPTYPFKNIFPHTGLDMAAPTGTPIYAAAPGVVAWARPGTTGYGNYIMIIHDNGLATLYAHMSGFAVGQDQYVSRGQVIGYVGSTGFSTGPHLHFEVRVNGVAVNPQDYLQ